LEFEAHKLLSFLPSLLKKRKIYVRHKYK